MNENDTGKEAVDAAVKVPRELGFPVTFGSNLMRERIERIANGLGAADLGVVATLREPCLQSDPGGVANAASPQGWPKFPLAVRVRSL